jgi:hypothetical protein
VFINVLWTFLQSGRVEVATETYLIVPDFSESEENSEIFILGSAGPGPKQKLHRVYKSKLLTETLNFENVVKGIVKLKNTFERKKIKKLLL